MEQSTKASTKTAADFAPEAQFLLDHPNLPTPRGLDFVAGGGIIIYVHTAEEVVCWAEAIGAEVGASEYQGNMHHSAYRLEPFYVSATAIVEPEAVSS